MALKVLTALDSAKTQYYHFKAIVIAGMGLFTDAYDLFCIPPIMKLLGRVYYDQAGLPNHEKIAVPLLVISIVTTSGLLGTVFGQLVFGRLGDLVGRRRVYGISLMLMVLSSLGCGLSIGHTRSLVLITLCFFRFWLGVGIGGDYPISATIMSEFANRRTRGSFVAAVFSMQGFGILTSSAVTMIVCSIFSHVSKSTSDSKTPDEADLAWRLILMFAAVPAMMTYYWRMKMPETARYTALVERDLLQAEKDMEKVLDVPGKHIIKEYDMVPSTSSYGIFSKGFMKHHGRDLFACASSWFFVDIVFYATNLFQSRICVDILPDPKTANAYEEAFQLAKFQGIATICTTIPGYFATVFFIDRIGRIKIQIFGFFCMALCLWAIGIPYHMYWDHHTSVGFFLIYGLISFFSNFGPNTTTFIVPAEQFPTRFRSTCHGISGAAGKVGAIIGSVGFLWASQDAHQWERGHRTGIGMTSALVILGGACILGMVVTYFFSCETMGRSLEDNEINEDGDDQSVELSFPNCLITIRDQRSRVANSAIDDD